MQTPGGDLTCSQGAMSCQIGSRWSRRLQGEHIKQQMQHWDKHSESGNCTQAPKKVKLTTKWKNRHLHLLAVATFLFLPCADQDAHVLCICYPSCPYSLKKVSLSIALQQKLSNQTSRQTAKRTETYELLEPRNLAFQVLLLNQIALPLPLL